MSAPDPRMRWWGWGVDRDATSLPDKARDMLRQAFSIEDEPAPPPSLDDVRLPEPALPPGARDRLASIVGEDAVRDDRLARVAHALGKSYPDLVRIRAGDASSAPDAIVYPASHDEVLGGPRAVLGGAHRRHALRRRIERRRGRRAPPRRLRGGDQPRPRPHGPPGRGGPRLAARDVRAGLQRPARGGAARSGGPHARALPAVVGVRDARRLCGHAFRGESVDGLRAYRRAGARRPAGGAGGHARAPAGPRDGGRARPARARRRLRGHARRDHAGHARGPARARRQAERGLGVRLMGGGL